MRDEKGVLYSLFYPVLRARPGPDGGNAQTNLSRSFLGRSQSSGGDRYANRSFKNSIASDEGDTNFPALRLQARP